MDFNYHQDIARHSFCDMVNDFDRNNKYAGAIERVVQSAKKRDGYAYVFDVGCGSGLLSMLALKFGADYVYAVEQNEEMFKTAKVIIEHNGFVDGIEIVRTRLEDVKKESLERGFANCDKALLPNIVTAELFDSEMIGEDALRIYKAIRLLVSPNALFVPTSGQIYIQVVNSTFFNRCHELSPSMEINNKILIAPEKVQDCCSSAEIQDLHLDRFSEECAKDILTDPILLFEFDFTSITDDNVNEEKTVSFQLKREILQDDKLCIIFWWSSRMDIYSNSEMTTAPHWILGVSERWSPWREHWLPIVYHFPIKEYKNFMVRNIGKKNIELYCVHDEYQFAFKLNGHSKSNTTEDYDCFCDVHRFLGRAGMFQFNNRQRFVDWLNGFHNCLEQSKDRAQDINVLYLGDFSPLPFWIAQHSRVKTVYIDVSEGMYGEQKWICYKKYLETNASQKITFYTDKEHIDFNVVAIDDYLTTKSIFSQGFGDKIVKLIDRKCHEEKELIFYPENINIHLDYFKFEQLFKNYRQVEETQEYNFGEYDRLIMHSRMIADDLPDLVNCSEYRSTRLLASELNNIYKLSTRQLFHKNFQFYTKLSIPGEIFQHKSKKQIALVLWLSFQNGNEEPFSYNGPALVSKKETVCKWPPFTNQFVQFFEQLPESDHSKNGSQKLTLTWNGPESGFKLFIDR